MTRGARFYRTDFQVHSPRDTNWAGARAVTGDERRAYAREFVAACRQKGLHAVAITDHHDLVFAPIIRAAAAEELDSSGSRVAPEDRLVVFPGLELTLAVPCQALLILDANFPEDRLGAVLAALAIQETPHDVDVLPPVTRLDHFQSLEDLYAGLDRYPWLRGRFTVFPNVTDGGYRTLMRSGMHAKYKNMPCVGGYLDGTVEKKVGQGNERIFGGLDSNWGHKRIALVQTSDSRSKSFEDLGKNSSWVKWSEPSAEALRQACLAQESRISQSEPNLPTVYIEAVHVSNSSFLGPVDLALNKQYTAIIGGRGTGKSSILDYIRWSLADNPVVAVTGDGEVSADARRRELISATLSAVGGQVETTFNLNGTRHVVRRIAASGEMLLKVGDGEFSEVKESVVQALLPVHAYSQKQLSSVAVRPAELTRFITAPIFQDLQAKDAQIVDAANRFRQNYGSLQRARATAAEVDRLVLTEKSLTDQASHLRSLLSGLSASDQRVLADRPAVEACRERVNAWRRTADTASTGISGLLEDLERLVDGLPPVPAHLPAGVSPEEIDAAREPILRALDGAREAVRPLAQALKESLADGEVASTLSRFDSQLTGLDEEYEDVKDRSATHAQQLGELSAIENRRKATAEQLVALRDQLTALGDPSQVHSAIRRELVELYAERSQLLADQCANVTQLSGGLLHAEVARGQGFQKADERFRALAAGSGIRSAKFDSLFSNLGDETAPLETWEVVISELEAILLLDESAGLTTEQTPTLSRLGLNTADQERLRAKLTVDGWLDLALTTIRDEPSFSYRTSEAQYIRFVSASAGQQATALLRVLLGQSGMPLIIDQPEEDLDSQVVQDVVQWVWESKSHRQVIFASHNPNLVVNGDAELVVVCDYRRAGDQSGGRIKATGAIDVKDVREEIARVMEGGEQAFRLRKDKYGF